MATKNAFKKEILEVYTIKDELRDLPYKERIKLFEKALNEEYVGKSFKLIRNDKHFVKASFSQRSREKQIYGDRASDRPGWKAKVNIGAGGEYGRLLKNASYAESEVERKKDQNGFHKNSINWSYFKKRIIFEGTVFEVTISVCHQKRNSYIHNVVLKKSKEQLIKKERNLTVPPSPYKDGAKSSKTSSIGNISHTEIVVNGKEHDSVQDKINKFEQQKKALNDKSANLKKGKIRGEEYEG